MEGTTDYKVNVFIVGLQKAGTTSILNYLKQHRDIQGHTQEEMTYFSIKEEFNQGFVEAKKRYYRDITNKPYLLAKHATFIRDESNFERLLSHNPDCKLILCLRNPVFRAFSSYQMEFSHGSVVQNFDEVLERALLDKEQGLDNWHYNVFLDQGIYSKYIERLYKFFSKNQVYIIVMEEFNNDPELHFKNLIEWLSLPPDENVQLTEVYNSKKTIRSRFLASIIRRLLSEKSLIKTHLKKLIPTYLHYQIGKNIRDLNRKKVNRADTQISSEAKEKLSDFYREDIRKVERLVGKDLSFWSI